MELEVWLACLEETAIGPCPKPDKSIPNPSILFIIYTL
jgi:hypothetical protein